MHWLTGQAHLRVVPGPGEVVTPIPYHGRQLTLYSHQGKQHKQQLEHQHISVGVHTYICVCVHECVRACMCVHVCWGGGLFFFKYTLLHLLRYQFNPGESKQASKHNVALPKQTPTCLSVLPPLCVCVCACFLHILLSVASHMW